MRQQHDVNIFADDHAGSCLVRELRVESVAKPGEEFHRPLQVHYRKVNKDLGRHLMLLSIEPISIRLPETRLFQQ
jgi:hypothetical protein